MIHKSSFGGALLLSLLIVTPSFCYYDSGKTAKNIKNILYALFGYNDQAEIAQEKITDFYNELIDKNNGAFGYNNWELETLRPYDVTHRILSKATSWISDKAGNATQREILTFYRLHHPSLKTMSNQRMLAHVVKTKIGERVENILSPIKSAVARVYPTTSYNQLAVICRDQLATFVDKKLTNKVIEEIRQVLKNPCAAYCGEEEVTSANLTILACGHRMHEQCLANWVRCQRERALSVTCPLCRVAIKTTPAPTNEIAGNLFGTDISIKW